MPLVKDAMIPPRQGARFGRESLATAVERAILSPMMYGRTDAGNSRPIGQEEWLENAGNASVVTDGAGKGSVTYARAFPRGTLAVVFSSMALTYVRLDSATPPTASGFTIIGPAAATFTVHWVARGY